MHYKTSAKKNGGFLLFIKYKEFSNYAGFLIIVLKINSTKLCS